MAKVVKFNFYPGMVIYGDGGCGKTTFCVKAAEMVGWERTLWLNTEKPILRHQAPVFDDTHRYGIVDLIGKPLESVQEALKEAGAAARRGQWLYDLVVLDSLTEADLRNFDSVPDKDKRQMFGEHFEGWIDTVWKLSAGEREPKRRGLGAMVLATAAAQEDEDKTREEGDELRKSGESPPTIIVPAVQGKFRRYLPRYFNGIFYLEARGGKRRLYLKPKKKVFIRNDWEDLAEMPSVYDVPLLSEKVNPVEEILRKIGAIA